MNIQRTYRFSAAIGALVWLVLGSLATLDVISLALIERIFLLAPLVIIPLGLALVPPGSGHGQQQLTTITHYLQPLGAAMVVIAFLWPPGSAAGAAAAVWLAVTGLVGLSGLLRLINQHPFQASEIVLTAGLLYLPIGGAALVFSRLGLRPLDFSDIIVLLTAMHFHYAGFAAPLIAHHTGPWLIRTPALAFTLYQFSVAALVVGIPLIAVGITVSRPIEVVGAMFLASGLIILAILMVYISRFVLTQHLVQVLLTVSGVCLMLGMAFVFGYVLGNPAVTIPQMIMSHGILNAIGFSLCGLLAWNISEINPT